MILDMKNGLRLLGVLLVVMLSVRFMIIILYPGIDVTVLWAVNTPFLILGFVIVYKVRKNDSKNGALFHKNCPGCGRDTLSASKDIKICSECGEDLSHIKANMR
jgi:ribosomal protein L37E